MIDPIGDEQRILERAAASLYCKKLCEVIQGRTYLHLASGGQYEVVIAQATQEKNLVQVVVYKSVLDGRVWTRPTSEFCDGRFVLVPNEATGDAA